MQRVSGCRRDSVSTLSETFNEMILLINDRHLRLDAADEWLSTVVNASPDGIIAIDEQGTITLFNPAAGRIFGWKAEDMIGRSVDCLMPRMRSNILTCGDISRRACPAQPLARPLS